MRHLTRCPALSRSVWAVFGALLFLVLLSPAAQARELRTGFTDGDAFQRSPQAQRVTNLEHAKQTNASVIRIEATWLTIGRTRPPSRTAARDPLWEGYRFAEFDANMREVAAAGSTPLVVITFAPPWAEGPNRPPETPSAPGGTWRPSPSALADFMTAIARRYSGRTPDPLVPGTNLPTVRQWQIWNEPNLTTFLSPQWKRTNGRLVTASPNHYRSMLSGAYKSLKAVSPRNLVVTGGLAPFGGLKPGDPRIPPARFMRDFVCVRGRSAVKAFRCPGGPARFDVLAAHPYPIGPPRRTAPNPDDVVVPDYNRLKKPLASALKAGNVLPRKPKQLWATELSWDSVPDPNGLSLADQALYMQSAFYVLWRQRVNTVVWYVMRDEPGQPQGRDFGETFQSGVFFRGTEPLVDERKPSFTAFRFPFTAYLPQRGDRIVPRLKPGIADLWGLAPGPGPVTIERQSNGTWQPVLQVRADRDRVLQGRLKVEPGDLLRARQGTESSLTWRVFR